MIGWQGLQRERCRALTGLGQYGAVGFSYGGGGESSGSEGSGSVGEASGPESEGSEGGAGGEADDLAANLGIDAFSVLLRRAEREEATAADGKAVKKKS